MITNATELLDAILADADMADMLGAYVFDESPDETFPAIAVLGSNEYVEGVSRVQGLEVLIQRTPTGSSSPLYAGAVIDRSWKVHLIEYLSEGYVPGSAVRLAEAITCMCPGTTWASLGGGGQPEIAGNDQVIVNVPGTCTLGTGG